MGVLRALGQLVKDPGPVRTAPGPDKEVPKQGAIGVGHRASGAGGCISP